VVLADSLKARHIAPAQTKMGRNYFDQFDVPAGAGTTSLWDGTGNFFDQFDEMPAMQLSLPPGVTEVTLPGGQNFIPLVPAGAPQASVARASSLRSDTSTGRSPVPLSQSGGNYFDRFDLESQPPLLPAWPDWMAGSTSSFGPSGLPDWMTDSTPAPASPASGNFFDQFDAPAPPVPPAPAPGSPPPAAGAPSPIPTPTPQPASGLNSYQGRGQERWNAARAQAAANPPIPSAVPAPTPVPPTLQAVGPAASAPASSPPIPKPLYSQFILGIKNAFGGDYGRTRQWFADNGYGDLLRSGAPSQPSMFDRYWALLAQYDADRQQAEAARKVGFGEAFVREGLRGLAGITEYENRLLSPAYWGIDATSRALTGYDPNLSAIPDYEAGQRNALAIQPYEEPTVAGRLGAAFGQALPMVVTAPLADAAIPAEGLSTAPEIAPTLWNATKAVAARIPRGIGAMMPAAALAAQDTADHGGSTENQLKAASLTMAMGAMPMLAESGASSLPLRIAERGAKSAALAIPANAWINNLQDPRRGTVAGFTADDVVSAIPQIVTGALAGGREMPFRAPTEAQSPMADRIFRSAKASAVTDPFLDRMRAALDGQSIAEAGRVVWKNAGVEKNPNLRRSEDLKPASAAKITAELRASPLFTTAEFGRHVLNSPIATKAYATLQRNGIDIVLYSEINGLAGYVENGTAKINTAYSATVGEAVSTMIHESKHVRLFENTGSWYGLRGVRAGEYAARALEFFFKHRRRPNRHQRDRIMREIANLGY
jgi:hypothetical protein